MTAVMPAFNGISASTGMPCLSTPFAVVDRDLDAVDELRALLRRLHVARRELGLRRDELTVPGMPAPPASVKTVAAWPSLSRGTRGSSTKTFGPGVIEIGDDDERRSAARRTRRHPPASP